MNNPMIEHPKTVDDDDENEKEKKDDKKDDDNDDDVNDDHTDHTLDKTQETSHLDTRKENMQTPIPSPHRSHRTNLSSDKTVILVVLCKARLSRVALIISSLSLSSLGGGMGVVLDFFCLIVTLRDFL
nr:hypothetical protein [Tanacetum cinerariifolium]